MPEKLSATLSFKGPEDFTLREVEALTRSIARLYDKLENLVEVGFVSEDSGPSLRRLEEGEPESNLVVKGIRYGSDLVIALEGGVAIGLAVPSFIVALQMMKKNKIEEKALKSQKGLRRILERDEGTALREIANRYAVENGMTLEELLELVGPELREFFNNRAAFVSEEAPYK